jgi:hypothetical protein
MSRFEVNKHPADVVQLLDEHHLAAISDHADRRDTFCDSIESFLEQISETEVVLIQGEQVETLEAFCMQLQRWLPEEFDLTPTIAGVVEALRSFPGEPMRRIFVWRDGDVMLEQDLTTFSRLVNALFAVAAEQEHLTPGRLIIHRMLITGNSKLGAYIDTDSSPFQRWFVEEDDELNLWEVFSCVDHPRVLTYRIDG